jgi:hypothetical protein
MISLRLYTAQIILHEQHLTTQHEVISHFTSLQALFAVSPEGFEEYEVRVDGHNHHIVIHGGPPFPPASASVLHCAAPDHIQPVPQRVRLVGELVTFTSEQNTNVRY